MLYDDADVNVNCWTLKVCVCERNASLLAISQRTQPKLNNGVVNPQHLTLTSFLRRQPWAV